MPPSSTLPEDHLEDFSPLTNQDVEILHQIIVSALQSSSVDTLPFRALFGAYESVLEQYGIDHIHDRVYLRFLLRLGGQRGPGQSLYETFETLLAEQGIQLEFDNEEEGVPKWDLDGPSGGNPGIQLSEPNQSNPSRRPSRRASFSSFYDIKEEDTKISRTRDDSRASLSRIPINTGIVEPEHPRAEAPVVFSSGDASKGWRGRAAAVSSRVNPESPSKNSGQPRPPNPSAHIDHSTDVLDDDTSSLAPEEYVDKAVLTTASLEQAIAAATEDQPYRLSGTQIVRDAETFYYFHIWTVARKALRVWRTQATERRHHYQELSKIAASRDREVLLRQSLEHWYTQLLSKQQAVKTEHFFLQLERRASKARDLYLLVKAFTHWEQCTSEEVNRTSIARQRILRRRYFLAWHEFTAVNYLKAQHLPLRKFMTFWRRRLSYAASDNNQAVAVYQANLVEKIYWRWFWGFCERRAPEWRNAKLRKRHLLRWVAAIRLNMLKRDRVVASQSENLRLQALTRWVAKSRVLISSGQQANDFRRRKALSHALVACQSQLRYLPMVQQVSRMVDWRIARSTFGNLVSKFRAERQAEHVNRFRITRSSWTSWNDRLRCQIFGRQIDDRRALHALYKWTLAERCVLIQRVLEQRLKRKVLTKLVGYCQILANEYSRRQQEIESARHGKIILAAMNQWLAQMQKTQQFSRLAHEYFTPRISELAFSSWRSKVSNLRDLDLKANHIEFYFRVAPALQKWKAAHIGIQRQKRRDAYAHVRKLKKINIARRVLQRWCGAANNVIGMRREAETLAQNQELELKMALFKRWRDRSGAQQRSKRDIEEQFVEDSVRHYFQIWLNRLLLKEQEEDQARLFLTMRISKIAHDCLRALQIKIFEIKSRSETAGSVTQWNEKRRFHALIRAWRDKALQKRGLSSKVLFRTPHSRHTTSRKIEYSDNFVMENELEAPKDTRDPGSLIRPPLSRLSPSPLGDISTPSKRAIRARALIPLMATPMTPSRSQELSNVLPSHLRAQPLPLSITSLRSRFKRAEHSSLRDSFTNPAALDPSTPRTP